MLIVQYMIAIILSLQEHIFKVLPLKMPNKNNKYHLSRQFVAWSCNFCSVVPLRDDANNEVYQEVFNLNDYFTNSDERLAKTSTKK